jgi:signal peptidase II
MTTATPASGVSRFGWLAFGLAALVVLFDQSLKHWVLDGLGMTPGESRPLLGPLLFTLVRNDGISFGFFHANAPWTRWAWAGFALAASVVLGLAVRRTDKLITGLAMGLIIGGAVGNLIDRIRLGSVVDFLDVHPLIPIFPWIFNIADAGITVGVLLLLADTLLGSRGAAD